MPAVSTYPLSAGVSPPRQIKALEVRVARLEQYLETQYTITRIIASASEINTALPRILQAICETADWDFGEVWYVNRQDNCLHCESTWCRPTLSLPEFGISGQAITFESGKGLPGRVWASGKPAWVPNVVIDNNFMRSMIAKRDGLHAGIAIPVRTEGAMIGILTFFSRKMRPVDRELMQILDTAGNQIGLFIERKRAEDEERAKAWLIAALEERQRLARDLHDSVTQTLFSASIMAEMLPMMWDCDPEKIELGLQELHLLTREALSEMRSLVSDMRSSTVSSDSDLAILLKQLVSKVTTQINIEVSLDINLTQTPSGAIQIALYRIAQETLNNIVKHAAATEVCIRLYADYSSLTLCIEDNGRGFDLAAIPEDHFGIAIMRERAEAIGAILQLNSIPGEGTCISIHTQLAANIA